MLIESLQTLGASLILFRVLPSTDFFRGVVITFAVCQIPSLLKVIVHEKRPNPSLSEIIAIVINVTAFIVQIGAIPFFSVGNFLKQGNQTILEGLDHQTYQENAVTLPPTGDWELPIGLLLLSLGWWENFVSGDWTVFGRLHIPFKHWRTVLQETRDTCCILIYPFKIGFTLLLARLLTYNTDFALFTPEQPTDNSTVVASSVEQHFHHYSLMYLQIGSGIVITYLSGLACKLHMQRVAFALPITLAPLMTLLTVALQCRFQFLPAHWHMGGWYCAAGSMHDLMVPMICAVILWLSYCIVVGHIWFPQSERMAKLEK